MTKILNLDALKVTRSVILGGRERVLKSMTVEQFIDAKDFNEKMGQADAPGQVALLIEHLLEYLEDTTAEELRKLDLVQLKTLMEFVRGFDQVKDEAATEGNVTEPKST